MNARHISTARVLRVLLSALLLTTLVFSSIPPGAVHASTFVVNETGDEADANIGDGICDVNPGNGTDNCTLRAAIQEANSIDSSDVITFSAPLTVSLTSALPAIAYPLSIDGTTVGDWVTVDGNGLTGIGLDIQSSSVTVKGLVMIDFDGNAIQVSGGADGVIITGNYIGMASNGTTDGGNTGFGVRVIGSPNIEISSNLISGNTEGGVYVSGAASTGAVITGNTVGMNAARTARAESAVPSTSDKNGITIADAPNATIGGTTSGARNYIAGNYGAGIEVSGASGGTKINGNYIGTSGVGEDAVANEAGGIRLDSTTTIEVGVDARNLISGNSGSGASIVDSSAITFSSNTVGLDIDGDTILGNTPYGVRVINSSTVAISGNTISGNTGSGILLEEGTTGVTVADNRIGVGTSTTTDLGNTNHGIYINNSNDNLIGNTSTGQGNLIAYNGGNGIYVANTTPGSYNSYGNTIIGNAIFGNDSLGIDLAPFGVTANDSGDGDDGPNYLQNFITFTAKETVDGVQIEGSLNTDASRPNYYIEFFVNNTCDSSGNGEGTTRIGTLDLAISSATTAIDYEIPTSSVSAGQFLTATVTYDEGTGGLKDTSEFSPCAVVQEPDSPGSSGVFVVNSTADTDICVAGGECTLRGALNLANAGSEPPYTITFNISGDAPHTIAPATDLPTITVPVIIKGKPAGYSGVPVIILDGSSATNGFTVSANDVTIDGLSLVKFSGAAIRLNATAATIKNNYIGLDGQRRHEVPPITPVCISTAPAAT